MSKFKSLADILNATFTERQQATILSKMRTEILREEQRIKDTKRAPRPATRDRPRPLLERHPDEFRRTAARQTLALPENSGQQSEAHERASAFVRHGKTGRAAYWSMTGPAPECGPAETAVAMAFYKRVVAAIEHGGWSHSERSALYDLEAKWGARAYGRDPRFQIAGTKPGRLPAHDEKRINEWRKKNP